MKERPILMKPEMVAAILAGRKTQTRRAIKPQPVFSNRMWAWFKNRFMLVAGWPTAELFASKMLKLCPYGQVGDRLWVRERHRVPVGTDLICVFSDGEWVCWLPDDEVERHSNHWDWISSPDDYRVRPSIHMPKWACRLRLEITELRVERLQEIDWHGLRAEGFDRPLIVAHGFPEETRRNAEQWGAAVAKGTWFETLWNSINGKGSWESNPWVWVVGFKPI